MTIRLAYFITLFFQLRLFLRGFLTIHIVPSSYIFFLIGFVTCIIYHIIYISGKDFHFHLSKYYYALSYKKYKLINMNGSYFRKNIYGDKMPVLPISYETSFSTICHTNVTLLKNSFTFPLPRSNETKPNHKSEMIFPEITYSHTNKIFWPFIICSNFRPTEPKRRKSTAKVYAKTN